MGNKQSTEKQGAGPKGPQPRAPGIGGAVPPPSRGSKSEEAMLQSQATCKDAYRYRLDAFYRMHNPKRMRDVLQILAQYEGHEEALFKRLRERYGDEPYAERVEAIYKSSGANPEKVAKGLEELRRRRAVGEAERFMAMLRIKYGPEPSFSPPRRRSRSTVDRAYQASREEQRRQQQQQQQKPQQVKNGHSNGGPIGSPGPGGDIGAAPPSADDPMQSRPRVASFAGEVFVSDGDSYSDGDDQSSSSNEDISDAGDDFVLRARLTSFYQHHAPEKVENVPSIVSGFRGKEEEMFRKLEEMYGAQPTLPERDRARRKLLAFYKEYNPEKIARIDFVLDRYEGRFETLFGKLRRVYPDADWARFDASWTPPPQKSPTSTASKKSNPSSAFPRQPEKAGGNGSGPAGECKCVHMNADDVANTLEHGFVLTNPQRVREISEMVADFAPPSSTPTHHTNVSSKAESAKGYDTMFSELWLEQCGQVHKLREEVKRLKAANIQRLSQEAAASAGAGAASAASVASAGKTGSNSAANSQASGSLAASPTTVSPVAAQPDARADCAFASTAKPSQQQKHHRADQAQAHQAHDAQAHHHEYADVVPMDAAEITSPVSVGGAHDETQRFPMPAAQQQASAASMERSGQDPDSTSGGLVMNDDEDDEE